MSALACRTSTNGAYGFQPCGTSTRAGSGWDGVRGEWGQTQAADGQEIEGDAGSPDGEAAPKEPDSPGSPKTKLRRAAARGWKKLRGAGAIAQVAMMRKRARGEFFVEEEGVMDDRFFERQRKLDQLLESGREQPRPTIGIAPRKTQVDPLLGGVVISLSIAMPCLVVIYNRRLHRPGQS